MFLKSFKAFALAGSIIFASPLFAQQKKELSFPEIFTNPVKDIINPLPTIRGWADNSHYIEVRGGFRGTPYTVDARTGESVPTPPVLASSDSVLIKNKDLIYKTSLGKTTQLTHDTLEEKNPLLSPDGKQVAFTRNNDLYSIDIASGKETRYTNDGSNVVYNGWASWVYYEEILGRPTRYKAFWWSPDSKHIAFMHFDDSKVPVFPLYGSTGQHGYVENTRYPEPGDKNPEVKMGIVATGNTNIVWTDFDAKADQYFGTPFWMADSKSLWMQWMNRDQNDLIIYSVNPETGKKNIIYEETQKTWVDWFDDMYFLKNGSGFILRSDRSGMGHFYYYDLTGKLKKQLTSGNWRVGEILLVDEKGAEIFFTARKEATTRVDLYRVSLKGGEPKRLTFGNFDHSVSLSPDGSYFVTTYSNVQSPPRQALLDRNGKLVRELGNAKGAQFDAFDLPKTELINYTTRDGLQLPMTVTYPLNFNPAKKYPVWVSIYGGPDAGTVFDRWKSPLSTTAWWAKEGIIQVAIDNRSAGHLGKTGMNYIYRQLGKYEIEDYMDAIKSLEAKGFVDERKVGITGTSFGGYMSAMALTYGAEVFTHGIAISSPTDWSLYDTHYTERFMGTPKNNPEGYKLTSVMTYADKLKGQLRIIHGDMDDNVHMQNSVQLINKLQDLNKDFEYMIYPGNRHGVSGAAKVRHNNQETARFIYKYLLERPIPQEFYTYWK